MKENVNKKSQLVFEPRVARKLLKMNDEIRFCPFCGEAIENNCDCHKNLVVDIKPYRGEEGVIETNRSVLVFDNNTAFKTDYNQLIEETKVTREPEYEQLTMDLD